MRIISREGTTTVYLNPEPAGNFSDPNSFRVGGRIQNSTLRQQVIVDTVTQTFTVVNEETITSTSRFSMRRHHISDRKSRRRLSHNEEQLPQRTYPPLDILRATLSERRKANNGQLLHFTSPPPKRPKPRFGGPKGRQTMQVGGVGHDKQPNTAMSPIKKNSLCTAITAVLLPLASLTLPPVGDLVAADFTRVTTGSIVTRAGSGRGCAWGDYNNDGFIDLYVAHSAIDGRGTTGGADFLFQNNRDGTFTENRAAAGILDPLDSQGCVWADYDNDGQL